MFLSKRNTFNSTVYILLSLRSSFTCLGISNRFLFVFSIVLSRTPSDVLALSPVDDVFFFFFLQDNGFGCFFLNFFFATEPVVSSTAIPCVFFNTFSLLVSFFPNVTASFILNSTVFRLISEGCSKTGVFLCRYSKGWPGRARRKS